MKKILFVIHTLGCGGAEKVLVDTVNELSKRCEVTVMTIIDIGAFKDKLDKRIEYKTMFKLPGKNKNKPKSLLTNNSSFPKKIGKNMYSLIWKFMPINFIRKLKIKGNYDVEVAFLEGITAKVVSKSKSKKIGWIHVDLVNEQKSNKVFLSDKAQVKCYSSFNKLVCVSNTVREQLINRFEDKLDRNKMTVLYNTIDSKAIAEKANLECEDIKSKTEPVIVTIGRLAPQKGYSRLVEALHTLNKKGYNFKMYIMGIGEEHEMLNSKVKEYNLKEKVTFLGFRENPYAYIKQADFFVCSSITEGFSTVATEASVLGIPTVTTDCSGMKELFGENEFGYIVENSTKGIEKGIKYFLDNPQVVSEYKERLPKLKARFDVEKSVIKVEELINEVINK